MATGNRHSNEDGLTLIELLGVIAIIALLMGILTSGCPAARRYSPERIQLPDMAILYRPA